MKADRTVVCWGATVTNQGQAAPGALGVFQKLYVGERTNAVRYGDNTVAMWGDNTYGQKNIPVGVTMVHISLGDYHSCGARPRW